MRRTTVSVPINIAMGSGVREFTLRLDFDPKVVAAQNVLLAADAGTGTLDVNLSTPGVLTISAALLQPMTGGGALVDVAFTAVGSCSSSTVLAITSCTLDGGALGCLPNDGYLATSCGVGGHVQHWSNGAPVGGASIAMLGTSTTAEATTNDLGQFAFDGAVAGTWQLEPQKSGDLRGAVTALDAAIALQAAAGLRQLDAIEALACDVTGNGAVTALDAARILEFVVGQRPHLPVTKSCGSDWVFIPQPAALPNQRLIEPQLGTTTCQPGGIILDPLLGDAPQQDFTAVLFGDCSGNWTSAAQVNDRVSVRQDVRVRVGTARRPVGGLRQWLVPIYVENPKPFHALEVRLSYDPVALPVSVRTAGVASAAIARYGTDGRGNLAVALASAEPVTANGTPVLLVGFDAPRLSAPRARLLRLAIDEINIRLGD
jgi:hypothetical protein